MRRNLLIIRIWLFVMVIVISLIGSSAIAQGATTVRVDPSAPAAKVNDTVNLSVKVDNVANLTAIELHLSFNPSVLEVISLTNGGFVVADFSAQNLFDNSAGTIDYAVAQMNRAPAQGSGTLLNIAFRAKANGISTVTLRTTQAVPSGLLLSDTNGISIQSAWVAGNVNVGAVVPTAVTPTAVTPTPVTPTPVTPTAVTPTANPAGSTSGTHVVRFGEYLFCIGRAYGVSPWAIAQANGLWWPYLIFANQTLKIPNIPWSPIPAGPVCQTQFTFSTSVSTPTSIPTAATPIPTTAVATIVPPTTIAIPPSNCRAYYVVIEGDTLYHIATQYGTSYAEVARVNQILDARLIYPGQRLCIP